MNHIAKIGFRCWMNKQNDNDLVANYDMFNVEREKISNSLGGKCLAGDDMKKIEDLTEKINIMRAEIVSRMRRRNEV